MVKGSDLSRFSDVASYFDSLNGSASSQLPQDFQRGTGRDGDRELQQQTRSNCDNETQIKLLITHTGLTLIMTLRSV